MNKKKLVTHLTLASVALLIIALLALCLGYYNLSPLDLINIIKNNNYESLDYTLIIGLRLPRIILAGLVGGALATSGLVFQSVLRNPLADPYLLGVSSGASLGVVLFITFINGSSFIFATPLAAFIGGIATIGLVFYLIPWALFKNRISVSSDIFILSGVITSFLCGALIIMILSIGDTASYQKVFFWMLGSLSLADYEHILVALPYILLILPVFLFYAKSLNLIQLGDEGAISLGVNSFVIKRRLMILASLLICSSVAVCGPIAFVGLIIPHLTKLAYGHDHRLNLLVAPIHGASFMILSDLIARMISSNIELPVGAITTFIGAIAFILILVKSRDQA